MVAIDSDDVRLKARSDRSDSHPLRGPAAQYAKQLAVKPITVPENSRSTCYSKAGGRRPAQAFARLARYPEPRPRHLTGAGWSLRRY
jgi:hypothetical protein